MTRVLVAYKKSKYQNFLEDDDPHVKRLLEDGNSAVEKLKLSHDRHQQSLNEVIEVLESRSLDYTCLHRGEVTDVDGYDLVVAVGGDGTVLDLSHRLDGTQLLAINSDPERSYGYFCAGASADFVDLLDATLNGTAPVQALMRFFIMINGVRHGYPILNDVLVCHTNPAAVTSVIMEVGDGDAEHQKSSGIWISTAAGSTAAIRSAGGYVMPLDSLDIQYLVREPCPPSLGRYRQLKGIRPTSEQFRIRSKMTDGCVYLDGPHLRVDFKIGDVFEIDATAPPLTIVGLGAKVRT